MLRTDLIRPVHELLLGHASRLADKTAFSDGRRAVGYAELAARTGRLAGHLCEWRLQPGDRAAICLGNRVETVESYLGIARASGIAVPLDPRASPAHLGGLLRDSDARVLITDPVHESALRRHLSAGPRLRIVVTGPAQGRSSPGSVSFETLAATEPATAPRDDLRLDDLAWLIYTSGTGGRPKGVLSTQRNCLWSVAAGYVPVSGLCQEDRVVWPLPLSHSLGHIVCLLGVSAVGATARLVEDLSADEVLRVLRDESATFLGGAPMMYQRLVEAAAEARFEPPPELRMCLTGGAPASLSLRRAFQAVYGAPLLDAFGSTETCGSVAITWPSATAKGVTAGLPVPGLSVRLVDPQTGTDVPDGSDGEVWVRGPSIMAGYHNDPAATATTLRDGWLRTGDLARRDPTGFVSFTARLNELIVRGTETIRPLEVEEVLRGVPGVSDAAVVGKAHPVLGEVPVAFLVPGPGGLDAERLLSACRARLPQHMVPEALYEVDRIPRTSSGKIIRPGLLRRPTRLRVTAGSHFDALLHVDWIPGAASRAAPVSGDWAVVGGVEAGLVATTLGKLGAEAVTYPDVSAVLGAIARGAPRPANTVVVVPAVGAVDVVAAAATVVDGLQAQLHSWRTALPSAQLTVATVRALALESGEEVPDLCLASVHGAIAHAHRGEGGGTLVIDLDAADKRAVAALARVVASAEPQAAVRSGVVLVPRLVRSAASSVRPPRTFDPQGSVLLSGASTERGAALARHLVTGHGVRHLVLLDQPGRGGPPLVTLGKELAARGAKVRLVAADDPGEVAETAHAQRRPWTTFVQVIGGTSADWDRRLAAVLDQVGDGFPSVLSVSVTTTEGVVGAGRRAEPAVTNAFVAALAQRRASRGLPALVIAGDVSSPGVSPLGLVALSVRDDLAMFDAALTVDRSVVVAARPDPRPMAAIELSPLFADLMDIVGVDSNSTGVRTSLRQAPKVEAGERPRRSAFSSDEP
ncbi:AMP-binding protein [Micromonospora sp. DT31]|uniref:AMP-binding protein n=1 Tax=Micromonospora sp. DT31 TaxID=3393434 RepID=UPI003CEB4CB9